MLGIFLPQSSAGEGVGQPDPSTVSLEDLPAVLARLATLACSQRCDLPILRAILTGSENLYLTMSQALGHSGMHELSLRSWASVSLEPSLLRPNTHSQLE